MVGPKNDGFKHVVTFLERVISLNCDVEPINKMLVISGP